MLYLEAKITDPTPLARHPSPTMGGEHKGSLPLARLCRFASEEPLPKGGELRRKRMLILFLGISAGLPGSSIMTQQIGVRVGDCNCFAECNGRLCCKIAV